MYSVRSDPLPWERLRTGVRGPAALVKSAAAAVAVRDRKKERKRRERSRCEF
jgi:hypothetical protein